MIKYKYNEEYSLYSEFDIDKHKETFIDYLEVIINNEGKIIYAVPSHIYKLEELIKNQLNLQNIQEVKDLCPINMWADYINWLLKTSGCVAVWNDFCMYYIANRKQIATLRLLKMKGLYKGQIPK